MSRELRSLVAVGDVLRSADLLLESRGAEDVDVMGVAQDSRVVGRGDLFLAWLGSDQDAHDYVAHAQAAGAVAAVVERPVDVDIPQLVVSDGRRAAALVAAGVMGFPSDVLTAVGITGTNGKTTTTLLLRDLLSTRMKAAAIGTLGLVDDDGARPGSEALTTPGPVQIARWLRELVDEGFEAVVLEASSHALAQKRLDGTAFDVAVFTNLSQDHLDYHGDLEAYRAAKVRLVELVVPEGTVVVNRDEPAWDTLQAPGRHTLTYGVGRDAQVRATDLDFDSAGSSFTLRIGGEARALRLPLAGRFNVENALAAASAASVVGLALDEIAEGLGRAKQIPGRMEVVRSSPFTVLIDFAHTPAALEGLLRTVRPLTAGRLIVLFGAGGERDRRKRHPMAEVVAEVADVVVLTSDNPRTEDPERILDDLQAGLGGRSHERITDRRKAIRRAMELARPGDTVVLAGKGHERYQVVGREKHPLDERLVVTDALADLGVE
ncbi:MAG: UDP-N-acetylmuramoyl-L-alanyl-D-glutamate--2,6-diaminopimelate ligase [Gemmatimonadota bacterium]|nr:UDP-N-acetylmuramoyl-L-alanyl-D-glutamate--2,6-diaminopimelate ligase [Gemmatimonadota bacterium]